MKIDTSNMVDMGEVRDYGPSEVVSKEEEKKPHYPDIYGLCVDDLEAVTETKVGDDVILVIKAKVKSLEVRDSEKRGKKSTANLEIREAMAYPLKTSMPSNNKTVSDDDLPTKSETTIMEQIED